MVTQRILPPAYLLISILVMLGLGLLFPITWVIQPFWNLLGLLPLALGILLNLRGSGFPSSPYYGQTLCSVFYPGDKRGISDQSQPNVFRVRADFDRDFHSTQIAVSISGHRHLCAPYRPGLYSGRRENVGR